MDAELMEKARAGLQGWQDGNLTALEELLDPNVELLWWEPGEWDCHSRDDVLRLLAQRRSEGVNRAEVADVERAVNHYQRLDFTIAYHDENYAFAHRDNLTIHLAHSEQPTTGPAALYVHVDDADRLAEDWRAAGVNVIGPDDYDYGKREGSHRDPDGNLLRFGSPLRR